MQNKENALLFKEIEELQEQNHKDYDSLKEQSLKIFNLKQEVEYLTKELEKAQDKLAANFINNYLQDNDA